MRHTYVKQNLSGIELNTPRLVGKPPSVAAELMLSAILLLLGVFGAAWSVISAFSLPVLPLTVILYALLFSAVFLVVFHLKRDRYLVLFALALGYVAAVYYLRQAIVQGLLVAANQALAVWPSHFEYILSMSAYTVAAEPEQQGLFCTVFALSAIFPLAGLLCRSIVQGRSFWLAFLITLPFLLAALVFAITPALPAVLMLLTCWTTLLFMRLPARWQGVLKKGAVLGTNSAAALKSGLLMLPAAALCFALILFVFPEQSYRHSGRAETLRSELADSLMGSDFVFRAGSMIMGIAEQLNLKGAGPARFFGKTVLRVRASEALPMYLKGFTGSVYTDSGWKQLPESAYAEIGPKLQDLNVQNLSHAYFSLFGRENEEQPNPFGIRVNNIAASRQRIFAPYNLITTPEHITGVRFVNDACIRSAYPFGTAEYSLSAYDLTRARIDSTPADVFLRMASYPSLSDRSSGRDRLPGAVRTYISQQRRFDTLGSGNLRDYYTSTLPPELMNMLAEDRRRFVQAEQDYRLFMYDPYTRLPRDLREKVQTLLKQEGLLRDYRSVGDMAAAVQDYLANGFSYTLTPGRTPDGRDFTEYFLSDSRKGYCVHFATAAAVMLRSMGVPARYADGYVVTPGDYEKAADGWLDIKDDRAHAWVELYYPGLGWQPFEVTPGFNITENLTQNNNPQDEPAPGTDPGSSAPAGTESQPEISPDSSPVGTPNEPDMQAALTPILFILFFIFALLAVLAIKRRCALTCRARTFSQRNTNRAAIGIYAYVLSLAKYGGEIDGNITELAEKARFSRHRLSAAELKKCRDFAESLAGQNYASLKNTLKFVFKYLDNLI